MDEFTLCNQVEQYLPASGRPREALDVAAATAAGAAVNVWACRLHDLLIAVGGTNTTNACEAEVYNEGQRRGMRCRTCSFAVPGASHVF